MKDFAFAALILCLAGLLMMIGGMVAHGVWLLILVGWESVPS